MGLYSSQIYLLEEEEKKIQEMKDQIQVKELMNGHYAKNLKWTNEIWGLFPLPENKYLTVSDDGTLRYWDANER